MSSNNNGQHSAPDTNSGHNGSATSDGGTAKNGNGRKLLVSTIPLVEPKEAASAKPQYTETAKPGAASPPAEPTDEASTADVPVEVGASSAIEAVRRFRGQVGPPQRDWPVEAQRRRERLKVKQTLAVDLLASGMTVSEVARKVDVNRRTIQRWYDDPVFMAELEDRRQELLDSMLDQRLLAGRMATAKLVEAMESSNEGIAFRAAVELSREGLRAYHTIDERKRIERLEDHLKIIYGWGR